MMLQLQQLGLYRNISLRIKEKIFYSPLYHLDYAFIGLFIFFYLVTYDTEEDMWGIGTLVIFVQSECCIHGTL